MTNLDTYLTQLKEYANISTIAYNNDWKTQRIVERTLQMLIETCLDIANHIISDEDMRMPTGYADTFVVLMGNKVIDKKLCNTMEKMTKFRNILVHQYEKIDPAIVITILNKNLVDFEKFKKAILKYLSL